MEILEIITEQVLVFDDGGEVLVLEDGGLELIAVAEQGPPGPQGIPGTEVSEIDCGTFN